MFGVCLVCVWEIYTFMESFLSAKKGEKILAVYLSSQIIDAAHMRMYVVCILIISGLNILIFISWYFTLY